MSQDKIKIAIAGGGICGLTLAIGLVKLPHLEVHVYEATKEYKDVGAGLALHLNAINAMGLIGPEVRQAYFDKALNMGEEWREMATTVKIAQGPNSGLVVAELGKAKGRKTVSRADLLEGYQALLPKDCISFSKRLTKVEEQPTAGPKEQKVRLTFADGSQASADVLIAADGVHSVARSYLLGADHPAAQPKNHDGYFMYRVVVPTEEASKKIDVHWTCNVPILIGPRGYMNCIPLGKGTRVSASICLPGIQSTSAPPLDCTAFADYTEDAQQIAGLVAEHEGGYDSAATWDHDHAPLYTKGAVCLVGDAAHATLPFAGNGAAQAIEDSAVLSHIFSRVTSLQQVEPALRAFDAVRRPRSQAVVDMSRKFGRVYSFKEAELLADTDQLKAFFKKMAAVTNNFDVESQNKAAMDLYLESINQK